MIGTCKASSELLALSWESLAGLYVIHIYMYLPTPTHSQTLSHTTHSYLPSHTLPVIPSPPSPHTLSRYHTYMYSYIIMYLPHTPPSHLHAGEKFLLRWYRGYLISVSFGGRGSGARTAAVASGQVGTRETMTLSIYDIQNQFVG